MEVLNPDGSLSDEARAATDAEMDAALVALTAEYEQAVTARQAGAGDATALHEAATKLAIVRTAMRERAIAAGTRAAGIGVVTQDSTEG